MTEPADPSAPESLVAEVAASEPIDRLAEQVSDLARVVTRQSLTLDRLVASDKARSGGQASDRPLLVDLFALYTDADVCARSAESEREAAAFTALRDGLERLIVGRDGAVINPCAGDEFDVAVMEAADTLSAGDASATKGRVAEMIRPGLVVAGRSVRPAMVTVYV
uniref:nucleotide exchange factor GrpE n=1 Tax=Gordonia sp. B7-2 TaxID=3420932 RepID=UPI003D8D705D